MKRIACLVLSVVALFAVSAKANDRFPYKDIQHIYAVTADEAIAYAEFPGFIEFRSIVADKMSDAAPSTGELSPSIYSLRLLGQGEQQTLFVGEYWISDGVNVAALSEEGFSEIDRIIRGREGQGIPLDRLDAVIRYHLAQQ